MKTNRLILKTALSLGIGLLIGQSLAQAQPDPSIARPPQPPEPPSIIVHGDGEVFATPDLATVRLGAEAQESEAATAQSAVNKVISAALKNIEELGVPKRSIKTTRMDLSPVYSPRQPGKEAEAPRIVAYRVSSGLQVAVQDLSKVGNVIDAAMTAGVNRMEGISFSLQDDQKERVAALRLAVADARTKAIAIANALDVKLGHVAEASEGGVSVFHPNESFGMRTMSMAAATPVAPGESRVHASVTLRYQIAPGPEGQGDGKN